MDQVDLKESLQSQNPTPETTKPRVIVIGRHDYILDTIGGILRREGFEPTGMLETLDDLPKKVLKKPFEVLLLGGGIDPHVRGTLIEAVQNARPDCHIVEHFGGPATIISEISEALKTR
ncbi:MAG: hypothetical protein KDC12_03455 [Flavobacteriales bacterium]|nr:hypothetical protein [Flavobacteriales bacterium]